MRTLILLLCLVLDTSASPVITTQPVSFTAESAGGKSAYFSVDATGTDPLAIQWRKDGVPIEGANDRYYTVTNVNFEDAGVYTALVSDTTGSVLSDDAVLTTYLVPSGWVADVPYMSSWELGFAFPRHSHTATLLTNGLVLIAGGEGVYVDGEDGGICMSCPYQAIGGAQLFDPATGRWRWTGSMYPRLRHTATLLTNGMVLAAGGSSTFAVVSFAELYDPSTETWTDIAWMRSQRTDHAATLLMDGRVLVTGGSQMHMAAQHDSTVLSTVELFDPATLSWSPANPMTRSRKGHIATLLPTGKVFVIGGSRETQEGDLFDPVTGHWTTIHPTGIEVVRSATVLPNGTVLVIGYYRWDNRSAAVIYDPVANSWTRIPDPVSDGRATLLKNGKVLVEGFGAGVFDPETKTWRQLSQPPLGRALQTTTLLPDGRLLMVGVDNDTYYRTTPQSWVFTYEEPVDLTLSRGEKRADGEIRFAFTNTSGAMFEVLASDHVDASAPWTSIGSADEVTHGQFRFEDATQSKAMRFYRVKLK